MTVNTDALLQILGWEQELLQKVKEGKYAFIAAHTQIVKNVPSYYTDDQGYTPFYINKEPFLIVFNLGWGVR